MGGVLQNARQKRGGCWGLVRFEISFTRAGAGAFIGAIYVNLRRVILSAYLVLFLGICLTAGVFFWQTWAEYTRLKAVQAQNERRLVELEARLREQEIVLERLRSDPAYVEKVIRRRLGYAKPDEFVFRFPE